jgi:transposase-like protein
MERRRFSQEFKVEVVKLVLERGVKVAQAARDLFEPTTVLRIWVRGFAGDRYLGIRGRNRFISLARSAPDLESVRVWFNYSATPRPRR